MGKSSVGAPRKRWIDDVVEDLKELNIRSWKVKAKDREQWKGVAREDMILHGLYSHWVDR